MSQRAPDLAASSLLYRLLRWKTLRILQAETIIPVHAGSRMRLTARQGEHGITTGIFLLRAAYEPSVRRAVDRFVAPGDTCYDIGANLGLWSLRMAEKVGPSGRVVAFEPVPDTARRLIENAALSFAGNIVVETIALGREEGPATIYLPGDIGRAALAAEGPKDARISVTQKRLDDVWAAQGYPRVKYVKLDVEGAEPWVLEGGSHFFRTCQPVISCEVNPGKLANLRFEVPELLDRLRELGYRPYKWMDKSEGLVEFLTPTWSDTVEDLVFLPVRRLPELRSRVASAE